MNSTLLSSDFQNRLDTYAEDDNAISNELAIILDTAKDPSLDEGAVISCWEYANIKHKQEVATLLKEYEREKEVTAYNGILRNHFRTGVGGNLFVILEDKQGYTKFGSKNYIINFMEKIGFTEKEIDTVHKSCDAYDTKVGFTVSVMINAAGYISICVVPRSALEEPIIVELASREHSNHLKIIKKAYKTYSHSIQPFSLKMVTNDRMKNI